MRTFGLGLLVLILVCPGRAVQGQTAGAAVALPAAGAAVESAPATTSAPAIDPRYRWHNDQWWYYQADGSWVVWNGAQWIPYIAPAPAPAPLVAEPGYPAYVPSNGFQGNSNYGPYGQGFGQSNVDGNAFGMYTPSFSYSQGPFNQRPLSQGRQFASGYDFNQEAGDGQAWGFGPPYGSNYGTLGYGFGVGNYDPRMYGQQSYGQGLGAGTGMSYGGAWRGGN
jgi:hypothetical protein